MCNSEKGRNLFLNSNNIEKDQNPNYTLNAPTLFMPIKLGVTMCTSQFFRLRGLSITTQINILSNNWRKAPWLIPWIAIKRINLYIYKRQFKRKLAQVRSQLGWSK